jgi:hypothetical protein
VELPKLCFPEYEFKVQSVAGSGQSLKIFDIIRRKYVNLTPEEWVRQHLLHFLVNERKFPQTLISVEKKVMVNNLFKRTDIVVYSSALKPIMIAECKAPAIRLTQSAFDQTARYNMTLGVSSFLVTNGLHYQFCMIDHVNKSYRFLKEVPFYGEIER